MLITIVQLVINLEWFRERRNFNVELINLIISLKKIYVIALDFEEEILGCGGTIKNYSKFSQQSFGNFRGGNKIFE